MSDSSVVYVLPTFTHANSAEILVRFSRLRIYEEVHYKRCGYEIAYT